ncbi:MULTISPECIES: hypothetical protein [unclassified Lentimonas]|uniref:hypothetical protein n=1 Tax=unclassified Lentimonas TaxID=2630993 RepID=UPI001325197D|nr:MULTISPECIES: hypothetical protein [unclassified Lentimonas]CAA6692345.1 Unannotated [Lentimonas sp. CC10]CAA6694680.1 Unannotated [Lentimonas sp. CC19]CAA7071427.1 Unannotated [Lentimonas sp. CC11]
MSSKITAFLLLAYCTVFTACRSLDVEPNAIILDYKSIHTITAVDGEAPERMTHHLHTVIPNVIVSPGTHEFSILYSKQTTPGLLDLNAKEIKIEATVTAGYYVIEDLNGSVVLKPTNIP